jgi:hypothetical protein
MWRPVFVPTVVIALVLSGCVAPHAKEEREKLEAYDAGKPVPTLEETETRDGSFGD